VPDPSYDNDRRRNNIKTVDNRVDLIGTEK